MVKRIPVILIVLIALVFANLHANRRSSQTDNCFNICGDARGYYAWLPAVFIYHDLNFRFLDSVEMKEANCGAQIGIPIQDYRYTIDGRTIDKYYPGTSVMMLPLFAGAHFATKHFTQYPADGYSPVYFKVMGFAGVFYYIVGMLFLLGLLGLLGLNTLQKTLTILLTSFGTNIIYYTIDAPVYSHIYSFALIAAFLYYCFGLRNGYSLKIIAILSFLAGWIFMARPVNVSIFLVLPFILGGQLQPLWTEFKSRASNFLYLLPALIMPGILVALYKAATGHYFIYSYGNEGFDFLHPHFWDFLTSYDNGVIPYMPLLFMPLVFLFGWYKKENKWLIIGTCLTSLVTIYIHSSWWAWSYGFSFGARTMLDFVPLFGILIALSLKQNNLKKYLYLLPVYILCCGLTVILYHQKSHGGFMATYPITDYWAAVHHALGIK